MATGDPWHDALMAFIERNEAEELTAYLNTLAEVFPPLARQMRDLALLVKFMQAKNQKRGRGKPKGAGHWELYSDANYVTAQRVERRMVNWKHDTGKARVPPAMIHEWIDEEASIVNTWKGVHNLPVNIDRVWDILRDAKSKRLLV
jgi:hypothetical protein